MSYCFRYDDTWRCNGNINCPWLSAHDEANCEQQCPTYLFNHCNCNKLENMTCEGEDRVCYNDYSKVFAFLILNRQNHLM